MVLLKTSLSPITQNLLRGRALTHARVWQGQTTGQRMEAWGEKGDRQR
jgi:hypothetical protein